MAVRKKVIKKSINSNKNMKQKTSNQRAKKSLSFYEWLEGLGIGKN